MTSSTDIRAKITAKHRHSSLSSARRGPIIMIQLGIAVSLFWQGIHGFTTNIGPSVGLKQQRRQRSLSCLVLDALRKNVDLPLLDVIDDEDDADDDTDADSTDGMGKILTPLPSSSLPDQLATPFVYGLQLERLLHKLIMEEATNLALTSPSEDDDESNNDNADASVFRQPTYGHLVWKDKARGSLVGAIGCTAKILASAPTIEMFMGQQFDQELLSPPIFEDDEDIDMPADAIEFAIPKSVIPPPSSSETTPPNTVLCRGGYRFLVVKEVIKTIPFPVVIVDEIEDDSDVDDSTLFSSTITNISDDDDDEEEDDEHDGLNQLSTPQLIQQIMMGVQGIVSRRLEDANAKNNLSPLEKSIFETSGLGSGNSMITPAAIKVAAAEEMVAVWEVFQLSLIDDIEPKDRQFVVAVMAAELADVNNKVRQRVILSRNSEERLRIVLQELRVIMIGMTNARKMASQITDEIEERDKNLKVGAPQLPKWALQIKKGMKVDYFWNEDYGWCSGVVTEDPVAIVDEILLTVHFDEDGETHKLRSPYGRR